ncbi:MAG: universal stress protein [Candidatus Methanoperedens sp.]|nr:universal stress protein [Candidatus Methanoperedens sp.]
MFERVLYATDFSQYAQKIMDCLGEIPGIKEIIVLHVIDTKRIAYGEENESVLIKKAELVLQEQKKRLESIGKTVKTEVKVGIPSREILRTADEESPSLVVMGARGMGLIKDILIGSVSSDVLRYGRTNLLIMRHKVFEQYVREAFEKYDCMCLGVPPVDLITRDLKGAVFEKYCDRIFSKVLYPTDFSKSAEQTISILNQIPNMDKIILMHAVDKGETKEELDTFVKEAGKKLKGIQKHLTDAGLNVEYHVHIGNPAHEINKVAEEEEVSLIAIGTRGKGLIEEIRLGSTAENVVRYGKRPVLVLRT